MRKTLKIVFQPPATSVVAVLRLFLRIRGCTGEKGNRAFVAASSGVAEELKRLDQLCQLLLSSVICTDLKNNVLAWAPPAAQSLPAEKSIVNSLDELR